MQTTGTATVGTATEEEGKGKTRIIILSIKHNNQPGLERPIKEGNTGNNDDGMNVNNRNGNNGNNMNSNTGTAMIAQVPNSTINLLRTAKKEADISNKDQP